MNPYIIRSYGPDKETQYVRLWIPTEPLAHPHGTGAADGQHLHPVAVLVHGGWWRNKYAIQNACHETLAPDLVCEASIAKRQQQAEKFPRPSTDRTDKPFALTLRVTFSPLFPPPWISGNPQCARGFAVMDVEYRRSDHEGGGYPGTNNDIVLSLSLLRDFVQEGRPLDLSRISVLGHSAGGTLALWYAAEAAKRTQCVQPKVVVAIAPITDLLEAYKRGLSDGGDAVWRYMKGRPEDSAEASARYDNASPHKLVYSHEIGLLIVAGARDDVVPLDMILAFHAQVADAARREDTGSADEENAQQHCELLHLDADHFEIVRAETPAWGQIFQAMSRRIHPG